VYITRAAQSERPLVKKVVSVSLGSSSRDHQADVELLGERFDISRVGTDGSIDKAIAKLKELDGTVDAIGLGGIDVYLYAGKDRYALRDGLRLLDAVKKTPVVDGSGLKNTLERNAIAYMQSSLGIEFRGKRVLMVSALDRFGMAQALVQAGADVVFGDFIFALDLDRPVRGLDEFEEMARKYLPDACKLPFQFFYPTGKKQDRPPQAKYPEYYDDAEIIAGDYHFMRQFMPDRLDGRHREGRRLPARPRDRAAHHDHAGLRRAVVRDERGGSGHDRAAREEVGRRDGRGLPRAAGTARPQAARDRVPGRVIR
jgi:hypothetical protein